MGNSFGCSASGERLVSAAREGDVMEAKMLLDCNPCLAKYSTFGGLNSPLHFAAAKGHNEIVTLLLENGADVNSRNYCGQTALMQACRYGHWEVVQSLLLFRCNVLRADYLSGRTALHFAAANGHARCMRLVVADFVPSPSFESLNVQTVDHITNGSISKTTGLSNVVNKAADGGITALHIAALNGYFDCVQLLLDLQANVSTMTFHHGTSMDLIGAGSTPLHYAACGGNLKCCQILLAKGSSRLAVNCNGCLPVEVARMWGRHWLEPLLAPNSDLPVPMFPPSNYLSLPLMSALIVARDCGLQFSGIASDDADICAVCLERTCSVVSEGCGHELCVRCSLYLCSLSNAPSEASNPPGSIPCPLCRHGILYFIKQPGSSDMKPLLSPTSCTVHPRDREHNKSKTAASPDMTKYSVTCDVFCPASCSPVPPVALPLCTCREGRDGREGPCPSFGSGESETREGTSHRTQNGNRKPEGMILQKTMCSYMFWGGRNCSRKTRCKAEISVRRLQK